MKTVHVASGRDDFLLSKLSSAMQGVAARAELDTKEGVGWLWCWSTWTGLNLDHHEHTGTGKPEIMPHGSCILLTKGDVKMCLVSAVVTDGLQTASAGAAGHHFHWQGCAGISSLLQRPGNGSCPSRCLCISSRDLAYPDSGASFQREAALHFPLICGAGLTSFP